VTPQARDWLAQPALARLWDQLRDRLERNGLAVRGRLVISDPSYAERQALGLLMNRAYSGGAVSVALADLDQRLRSGAAACGLTTAVAELRGPLTNRPAAQDARRSASQQTWTAARDALVDSGLGDAPWAEPWLTEIRRAGTLSRLGPDRTALLMTQAVDVLARLLPSSEERGETAELAQHGETAGRGELAERVTGTAHGLDDDTLLAKVVLRALARARDVGPPQNARERRELWEASGVSTDGVSSTALTYGLAPLGDDWPARLLRDRARAAAETHLTMRDLRRIRWQLRPGTEVFVCENPRVIEAAADAGCQRSLVCTAGNPATIVLVLLDALVAAGARLAYRGDFDWPGVAMANRMFSRYGARPWRMSATDYEEHAAAARDRGTPLQPLSGIPVDATWDAELTPAMCALGLAIQEESALELILADVL
jgi:uncharacterized protein (TIGR02679 family)